jgi:hypothetical protein
MRYPALRTFFNCGFIIIETSIFFLLALPTLIIPSELTWFTFLYAAVGFGFGVAYVVWRVRGPANSESPGRRFDPVTTHF